MTRTDRFEGLTGWRAGVGLVLTAAGAVFLASCGSSAPSPQSAPRTMTVTAIEVNEVPQISGKTVVLTSQILQQNKVVGSNDVGCFLTGPGNTGLCFASTSLAGGQILSQASLPVPPPAGDTVTAIVGGTGAYAGARGTIDSVRGNGPSVALTFHITLG